MSPLTLRPDADPPDLDGRTIVVTGGTNGLGRAMSIAFAASGAHVVIGDVAAEPRDGEPTRDVIRAAGGSATFVATDVSRADDVDRLVATAVREGGRLDVIVTNAGRTGPASKGLLETSESDWDAMMAVNLRGVFLCCKRAVAEMLTQEPRGEVRGRVITIVSQFGFVGSPGHLAYSAGKGGVANMTRQLAVDFGHRGVLVNGIAPGKVPVVPQVEGSPSNAYYAGRTPLGRFGRPDEVAGAALFLASDLCTFMSGAILAVDGGWLAY
jgi:NAD(P)-dependent dehydrogenase (short-subunit alcohol dehydrogenase family)